MTEQRKYELSSDRERLYKGRYVRRIRALCAFADVQRGQYGGWIEKEENLSQSGDAWVYGNGVVTNDAQVLHNARVSGNAIVSGHARITDVAVVEENAIVTDNAHIGNQAHISDQAYIKDNAQIEGCARISGLAVIGGAMFVNGRAHISGNVHFNSDAHVAGTAQITRSEDLLYTRCVVNDVVVDITFYTALARVVEVTYGNHTGPLPSDIQKQIREILDQVTPHRIAKIYADYKDRITCISEMTVGEISKQLERGRLLNIGGSIR